MKSNLKKSFIWNTLGSGLHSVNSFFFMVIATRLNGLDIAGIFTACFATSGIFYFINVYSGRTFQVTESDKSITDKTYIRNRLNNSLVVLLIAFIYILISGYTRTKLIVFLLLLLFNILDAISDVYYGILQKNDRLDIVGKSLVVKSILNLLSFFLINIITHNIIYSCLFLTITSFIVLIFMDKKYANKYISNEEVNKEGLKKIYKYGFYTFSFTFVNSYLVNASRYSLDHLMEAKYQTIFGIILMPATVILLMNQFIIQPLINPLKVYYRNNDRKNFYKLVNIQFISIIIFTIISIIIAYFIGIPVLNIIYNLDLSKYLLNLILILIGAAFYALSIIMSNILIIFRQTKKQFIISVISIIFSIIISYIFINKIGFNGATYAYLLTMIIYFILYLLLFIKNSNTFFINKNDNKRIAFVNVVCNGSTGRISENIALEAKNKGYHVKLFFGRGNKSNRVDSKKISNKLLFFIDASLSTISGLNGRFSIIPTKVLIYNLKKFNPDIIHLHVIHGFYLNYNLLFNYLHKEYSGKVIWTLHDCLSFTGSCGFFCEVECNKWKTECGKCPLKMTYPPSLIDNSKSNYLMKKRLYGSSNNILITTVSNWLYKNVKESFLKNNNVVVIENSINFDVFKKYNNNEIINIKKNKKLDNKKIYLSIANIWSDLKGIKIINSIEKELLNDEIIIVVGKINERDKINSNKIIYIDRTDSIEELVDIYNIADVMINPSVAESFSMVTLESIACGTPVIVFNNSAVKDLIINEESGFIIDRKNYNNIDFLYNSRKYTKKISNKTILNYKSKYSNEVILKKYIDLYESVIK